MILIDTDILVDYFRNSEEADNFIEKNIDIICISYFTRLELLIGAKNKREMLSIDRNIKFPILTQNDQIAGIAVDIIKGHFLKDGIGIIDAIIAATAIYYKIDFYSKNIRHYKNIKDLKLHKPY